MPTINAKQVVLIILSLLSFTAAATTQLTDVFGPGVAKGIASVASLLNGMMSAALAPFLSNSSVVKDAGALDGVNVRVTGEAAPQIAALAVAPDNNGIEPARGEEVAVQQKAAVA